MLLSKRSIPHFTYVEEVDVTEMVALREELNRQYAVQRGELSPLALAIRAIVRAVADFPQVNARFDDEAGVLTLYDAVHLGVATQTDGGLMVPVLRQAQTLNLWDCSLAIAATGRQGARRQGHARRTLGLHAHRHQPRQARRHRLDAGDQPPRGGDRRHQPHRRAADGARRRGAGAADDEPVVVVRSPGGGWGGRGGLYPAGEAVAGDAGDAVHRVGQAPRVGLSFRGSATSCLDDR